MRPKNPGLRVWSALEKTPRARNVVLEFKDYATAVACYHSPEYAAAKALRDGRAEADLLMAVNGWPTLQAVREAGAVRTDR